MCEFQGRAKVIVNALTARNGRQMYADGRESCTLGMNTKNKATNFLNLPIFIVGRNGLEEDLVVQPGLWAVDMLTGCQLKRVPFHIIFSHFSNYIGTFSWFLFFPE